MTGYERFMMALHPDIQARRRWGQYPLDLRMVEEYQTKNYIAKYMDQVRGVHWGIL